MTEDKNEMPIVLLGYSLVIGAVVGFLAVTGAVVGGCLYVWKLVL